MADEIARAIREAITKYGPITDRWVLRLGKLDGEFEPWHLGVDDYAQDFDGFLKCLALTRAHEEVKDRMSAARKARTAARRAARLVEKEAAKEKAKLEKALAKAEKKRLADEAKAKAKADKKAEREKKRDEAKAAKLAAKEAKKVAKKSKPLPVACHCPPGEIQIEHVDACPNKEKAA